MRVGEVHNYDTKYFHWSKNWKGDINFYVHERENESKLCVRKLLCMSPPGVRYSQSSVRYLLRALSKENKRPRVKMATCIDIKKAWSLLPLPYTSVCSGALQRASCCNPRSLYLTLLMYFNTKWEYREIIWKVSLHVHVSGIASVL